MFYTTVISVLGYVLAGFAATMLLPALVAFGYDETDQGWAFLVSAVLTAFVGVGLIIATRGAQREASHREGYLLALLVWAVLPVFGAVPLYYNAAFPSMTGAYFEALSGLTTTGATVLSGLETIDRSILFWRGLLTWLGGFATIILAVALLSLHGIGGMQLFRSAMPRGERQALAARLGDMGRSIWWIYAGLTLICAALLWAAGLPPFDALAHAFSTLSTGGFSTHDGSVGSFDNPLAELVLIVFMAIAALNFTLHWALFNGRGADYWRDPEVRYFLALSVLGGLAIAVVLHWQADANAIDSVRTGVFNAVSMLTTTGFTTGEVSTWPAFMLMLLLIMALIGGSSGSTAGGIKLMRFKLFLRQVGREMARLPHPHGVIRLHYDEQTVSEEALRSAWSFFMVFLICFVLVAAALSIFDLDMRTVLSATTAAFSNNGPALLVGNGGAVSYDAVPDGAKWILCAAMLLGRLELLAILVLFRGFFLRH